MPITPNYKNQMNTQIEIKQADAEIAELKTKLEIAQKRRDTLASADHAVYASKVMTIQLPRKVKTITPTEEGFAEFDALVPSDRRYCRQTYPDLLKSFFGGDTIDFPNRYDVLGEYWKYLSRRNTVKNATSTPLQLYYVHPEFGDVPYPDNRM